MIPPGFLRDILANPDDDTVRLILADWLTDHGEPERAEFIRVQIELANHPAYHTAEAGCPLCREQELFKVISYPLLDPSTLIHALRLTQESLEKCDLPIKGLMTRGFVSEVHLTCADFILHGKAIAACQPVAKWVLTDRKPYQLGYKYTWLRTLDQGWPSNVGDAELDQADLPDSLFVFAEDDYPTEQAALDALSAAAKAWARET